MNKAKINRSFVISLTVAEFKRFARNGLVSSLLFPFGIGFLIQIAVPEHLVGQRYFDPRVFYSVIFCFFVGITNASRRIVGERRVLDRLRLGGASAMSIFTSKLIIVLFAAVLHGVGFFSMFVLNAVDLSRESSVSSTINLLRYGRNNLSQWNDRESNWHLENEDPFNADRDPYYGNKLSIGRDYYAFKQNDLKLFTCSFGDNRSTFQIINRPGVLYALFLSSASAGLLGLLLSAFFSAGRTDRVLMWVPFVTAFQIMYARVTTVGDSELFGSLSTVLNVYEWFSLYHLLSFLTYSRYLIVISDKNTFMDALFSLDAYVIYFFMGITSMITVYLLRNFETP